MTSVAQAQLEAIASSSGKKFLGSASCASSNCHGSVSPRNSTNVLQNEYTTWFKHGAHAQAWRVLTKPDSKRIAQNLGIKSAVNSELCLKCHSTYVPKPQRGRKFRIQDGVGCESCHGASEAYIKPHTAKDSSHSENVRLGMIDLVSLERRAKVCMDCHFGNDGQTVDHRLIGAGHPRLTYELDTYGLLQPNHWEVDEDYARRKAPYNSTRAWVAGQLARATEMVNQMSSKKRSVHGVYPELTLFNCYNCHHSLSEDQWKSRGYGGYPGELQLNTSSLKMLALALEVLAPKEATLLNEKLKNLPIALRNGNGTSNLKLLKQQLSGSTRSAVNSASYKKSVVRQILKKIVSFSAKKTSLPYETAEQAAMAMSAFSATLGGFGQSSIDKIYDALKNEEKFSASGFTKAAKDFKKKL